MKTVTWTKGKVRMIDQTALPQKLSYVTYTKPEQVASAIKSMVVRGAPAIGVAAAMGVALAAFGSNAKDMAAFKDDLEKASTVLRATRPTAVNLFWGIDRVLRAALDSPTVAEARQRAASEVMKMEEEDVDVNRRLGEAGASLVDDGDTILTQCNAGALATVGYGTALGVVRAAVSQGK